MLDINLLRNDPDRVRENISITPEGRNEWKRTLFPIYRAHCGAIS